MWFGTADGLNKFDGYEFTTYRDYPDSNTSLLGGSIRAISQDVDGNVWVGTDRGLSRLNLAGTEFRNYQWFVKEPFQTEAVSVWGIAFDSRGNIWLATNFGLRNLDVKTGRLDDPVGLKHAHLGKPSAFVQVDKAGMVWYADEDGINRYDPATRKLETPFGRMNRLLPPHDRFLKLLPDGRLVFEESEGVIGVYDPSRGGLIKYVVSAGREPRTRNPVGAACELSDGEILIGAGYEGLRVLDVHSGLIRKFEASGFEFTDVPLSDIRALFRDRSGCVWIGTDGGGIMWWSPYRDKFPRALLAGGNNSGTAGNFVKAIFQDARKDLWIATIPGGLSKLDPGSGTWKRVRTSSGDIESNEKVFCMRDDPGGNIWVGTQNGVKILDEPGDIPNMTLLRGKTINTICMDSHGTMWLGTNSGLFRAAVDAGRVTLSRVLSVNIDVFSILEGSDGTMWIGSYLGFVKHLDARGSVISDYSDGAQGTFSRSNNIVRSICEEPKGVLWLATENGLVRLDEKSGRRAAITAEDGLPSNFIYGVLSDAAGNLWLSTNRGLCRFSPSTGKSRNYDVDDGLQSNEFNTGAYFKSDDGTMYFGGVNGLNSFKPADITDNPITPRVVITEFTLQENHISVLSSVRAPYNKNTISFEMAALEYTNPSKNQYAYRLDGFDTGWNYSGTVRFARYTNLPPGKYVLRVKASNSDGVWNESGIAVPVEIVPPFWMTWEFREMASVLSVVALVGSIRYVSLRKIRKQLERVHREQALERERSRISRDLHDDVGSILTKILFLSSGTGGISEGMSEPIRRISRTAEEAVRKMDEIVWAVNPRNDNLRNLWAYITEYAQELFDASSIAARFDFPPAIPEIELDSELRHEIFLVVKESLSNVLKHSRATTVNIGLEAVDDRIRIIVADDGTGIQATGEDSLGNGLRNMRERAERIGGILTISRAGETGTRVSVEFNAAGPRRV